MTDLFGLLRADWPNDVHEAADKAATSVHGDPRAACFHARRTVELATAWAFKYDAALKAPYQDNLMAWLHEPTFKTAMGEAVFLKAKLIVQAGDQAVHRPQPVGVSEAPAILQRRSRVRRWTSCRSWRRRSASETSSWPPRAPTRTPWTPRSPGSAPRWKRRSKRRRRFPILTTTPKTPPATRS